MNPIKRISVSAASSFAKRLGYSLVPDAMYDADASVTDTLKLKGPKQKKNTVDVANDLALYHAHYPEESVENKRFFNVGAGSFRHPMWSNIDYVQKAYKKLTDGNTPDFNINLLEKKPFPIPSDSAELAYTSHTIEHLDNDSVQVMFNECHRILKPGGIIRIAAPDLDIAYRAYQRNDMHFFRTFTSVTRQRTRDKHSQILFQSQYVPIEKIRTIDHTLENAFMIRFLRQVTNRRLLSSDEIRDALATKSKTEAMDYFLSLCSMEHHQKNPGDHVNWFNFDKLETMLKKAGFPTVYATGYGQSAAMVMRNKYHFDRTRPTFSLYVEAIK